MGLKFIPEQMCSSPVSASDLEWFNDDLPSPQSLPAELHFIWQARWKVVPNPPTTLQGSVAHCDSQLYPIIYTVLSISCVFHLHLHRYVDQSNLTITQRVVALNT
ncbi:hypothetical protein DPMN_111531 [Dreissena polymorpha]|uniref:Uncharacterized protein n=1 Tax=Dreissena polymorpha TaxID=45954 RepID=A0A9D4QQ07_DREPO|nr:hypothetical protein DPMN_111531 [Dreissena polymorpha]